jgi:hypothetical protein
LQGRTREVLERVNGGGLSAPPPLSALRDHRAACGCLRLQLEHLCSGALLAGRRRAGTGKADDAVATSTRRTAKGQQSLIELVVLFMKAC